MPDYGISVVKRKEDDVYNFSTVLFPISKPRITLVFADRTFKDYRNSPHMGTDMAPHAGSCGTPIISSVQGRVTAANLYGSSRAGGNELVIEASLPFDVWAKNVSQQVKTIPKNQVFQLRYLHLQAINCKVGQVLTPGQQIAVLGNTGHKSTGCHLHLELIYQGEKLDVLDLFVAAIPGLAQQIVYLPGSGHEALA